MFDINLLGRGILDGTNKIPPGIQITNGGKSNYFAMMGREKVLNFPLFVYKLSREITKGKGIIKSKV